MRTYNVAVIPGDGIGNDVIPEGLKVLDAAQETDGGFSLKYDYFPWGCEYYLKTGKMMDDDGLKRLAGYDAIFLGAVGFDTVPDHVSLWGLLIPIRQGFDQYVNLRPVRLLPGIEGPLRNKGPEDINFVCVRENSEGEYSGVGGRVHVGTPQEVAMQTSVFTRHGIERVARYSFDLARARAGKKKLTSVTKSNALNYSMVFWDEVVADIAKDYPDITIEKQHVDLMSARFVRNPEVLDVVVASNLFGDILTDLGGALQGSLGIPPAANLNPERKYPSMFEPVHGSAPKHAGKGVADPIATVWAASMMMEHLGEKASADLIMRGIEAVTAEGKVRTPDLGGRSSTSEVGSEIAAKVTALAGK